MAAMIETQAENNREGAVMVMPDGSTMATSEMVQGQSPFLGYGSFPR